MSDELYGQMSFFDLNTEELKGARYTFKRYMGQSVRHKCGASGKITKIEQYYTTFVDERGKEYIGTPYDLAPLNPELDDFWMKSGAVVPCIYDNENEWKPFPEGAKWYANTEKRERWPGWEEDGAPDWIVQGEVVIDGKSKKGDIALKEWVSGPDGIYHEFEPIKWREALHGK